MNIDPLLTSPMDLRAVTNAAQESAIRAYRDGFQAALVAVNNNMLGSSPDAYRAVQAAIRAAEARLEASITDALEGDGVIW